MLLVINKPKRKRITPYQLAILSDLFASTDTPNYQLRENTASKLNMTNREVQVFIYTCEYYNAKLLMKFLRFGSKIVVPKSTVIDYKSKRSMIRSYIPSVGLLHQIIIITSNHNHSTLLNNITIHNNTYIIIMMLRHRLFIKQNNNKDNSKSNTQQM